MISGGIIVHGPKCSCSPCVCSRIAAAWAPAIAALPRNPWAGPMPPLTADAVDSIACDHMGASWWVFQIRRAFGTFGAAIAALPSEDAATFSWWIGREVHS